MKHFEVGSLVSFMSLIYDPGRLRGHKLLYEKAIVLSSKQVFKAEDAHRDYEVFIFSSGTKKLMHGSELQSVEENN